MRFSVLNIGCKVNRVEIDTVAAQLLSRGAELASSGQADVVVVNTCTVTAEADKKTRKAVRQALRENPQATVLVTGCAAVMNPEWFEGLDGRVRVVSKPDVADAAWGLLEALPGEAAGEGCMLRQSLLGEMPAGHFSCCGTEPGTSPRRLPDAVSEPAGGPQTVSRGEEGATSAQFAVRANGVFRTRVGVKVQDGCNNACTYCIVHVARGTSWSVPFNQVVDQARAVSRAGAREIVLTGINLGAYDDAGRTLADVLAALLAACPDSRFRIGSVEPCDVDGRLIQLMAESDGRVCRHLHVPLQSGSSRVLREMDRPYDADAFLGLVERLRAAMPGISVGTDIIVGFPGETEDDFGQTLQVARAAAFSKVHVFRYSRREGTPAAERVDQVDPRVAARRSQELQRVAAELRRQDARRRLGTHELVLVERAGQGMSESYHTVRWAEGPCAAPAVGQLVDMELASMAQDGAFVV